MRTLLLQRTGTHMLYSILYRRVTMALGRGGAVSALLGGRGGTSCGTTRVANRHGVLEAPNIQRSGRCVCQAAALGAGRGSGEDLGSEEDGSDRGADDRTGSCFFGVRVRRGFVGGPSHHVGQAKRFLEVVEVVSL
jgi:hypothetical protein